MFIVAIIIVAIIDDSFIMGGSMKPFNEELKFGILQIPNYILPILIGQSIIIPLI